MKNYILFLIILSVFVGCKSETKKNTFENSSEIKETNVEFAKGFDIQNFDGYKVITITNAWPGTDKIFTYAVAESLENIPEPKNFDAVVKIPVENIVVTSTTHIPSLEMLGVSTTLKGFPNLDYISSEATRKMIDDGKIKELGKNEDINTEVLIELNPDLVVGFTVDGTNSTFSTIKKTGIPVVYNGDWTEKTPLGKAEWIKFFGAFYNKEKQADSIFNNIKTEYLSAKKIAETAKTKPTVLSGAMYKDIWYMPQGNSWAAQFIADATGEYLWADSEGTGSISLNIESVLEKGQNAEYWIGPGQFSSLQQMKDYNAVYSQFNAFKSQNVYSFTNKKGATGGVLYYELAPNRPDLVLKDLIKILHPELIPDYEMYFFSKLN